MHLNMALFYGGPDQLLPLTTGFSAVVALALIFWNKILVIAVGIQRRFRRARADQASARSRET